MSARLLSWLFAAFLPALLIPVSGHAQSAWPSRAIRFVVPFAPGGSSEIIARAVAARLSESLGHSVYVENKPGGAGNVAMAESGPQQFAALIARESERWAKVVKAGRITAD